MANMANANDEAVIDLRRSCEVFIFFGFLRAGYYVGKALIFQLLGLSADPTNL